MIIRRYMQKNNFPTIISTIQHTFKLWLHSVQPNAFLSHLPTLFRQLWSILPAMLLTESFWHEVRCNIHEEGYTLSVIAVDECECAHWSGLLVIYADTILMQVVSDSVYSVVHYALVLTCTRFPGYSRRCSGSMHDVVFHSRVLWCSVVKKYFLGCTSFRISFCCVTILCMYIQLSLSDWRANTAKNTQQNKSGLLCLITPSTQMSAKGLLKKFILLSRRSLKVTFIALSVNVPFCFNSPFTREQRLVIRLTNSSALLSSFPNKHFCKLRD